MAECESCEEWRWRCIRLKRRIEELETSLSRKDKELENFGRIKREHSEMKRAQERSYDAYITDPMRGQEEGEET